MARRSPAAGWLLWAAGALAETLEVAEPGALPPFATPIQLIVTRGGPIVKFCDVNLMRDVLASTAFFHDLTASCVTAAGSTWPPQPGATYAIPLSHVARLIERDETRADRWAASLGGIVVHAARVGSTAVANMIGEHPDTAVLKEPGAITDVLLAAESTDPSARLSSSDARRALRLICHIFFRSAASQRMSALVRGDAMNREAAAELASRTRVILKLATAGTASPRSLALLRAAFPTTPFAYLVRSPVETVASLLHSKGGSRVDLHEAPCLRWRGRAAQLPFLVETTGVSDVLQLSAEQYCAAHVGALLYDERERRTDR